MGFKPAQRKNAKLRLAVDAPSGHGKTFSALLIALQLGKQVAVADSERSSALKYSRKAGTPIAPGNWDFLHDDIDHKNPNGYVAKISEAADAGVDVLILDSMSHEWQGALEKIDSLGGWTRGGKTVSPEHQRVIDAILSYPGHVICTFRSKMEHAIEKDDKGKTTVRKMGMAPVAREGTEYEFDFWLTMQDGSVTITKSRWGEGLPVGSIFPRHELPKLVEKIKGWLDSGAPVSAVDAMVERIKFARDDAALVALAPEIKAMSAEDKAAVQPHYVKRKGEIAAGPPAGVFE